jgi:hypothetical protein
MDVRGGRACDGASGPQAAQVPVPRVRPGVRAPVGLQAARAEALRARTLNAPFTPSLTLRAGQNAGKPELAL